MILLSQWWQQPAQSSVALMTAGGPWTDAQLRVRVTHAAAYFAQHPAYKFVLHCEATEQFIVALLALWQAGKTAVLPASGAPQELLRAQEDGAVLIASAQLIDWAESAMATDARAPLSVDVNCDPARICLQLFTSGSTGMPQRVTRTFAQLQSEIHQLDQRYGVSVQNAVVLSTVPHQHIYGLLFRLLWPLCTARLIDVETYRYPEDLHAAILRCERIVLVSSPAHLERLPQHYDWRHLVARIMIVFCSGAPLSRQAALALRQQWQSAPQEILGSTETGGVAWRCRDESEASEYWTAFPGVNLRLRAADQVLEIQSPAAQHVDWCALGDRAQLFDDRRFALLGRADRIIKVEGKRVSLAQIEGQLTAHPFVARVMLCLLPQTRTPIAPVIVLTDAGHEALTNRGKRFVNEALRQHLLQQVERVVLPRRFRYVDSFPVDARGKITQAALLALFDADGQA